MKREIRGQRMIPDIIVSRYTGRPYDVSRKKPQTHHPTVLDMMEVGDLEVRNTLIDQCHADTDLLIEKRLEAERAYTIEGDQILAGRFYANKKRPLGIIKESVDTAIEEEQRRLRDLETQRYNLDNRLMELQKESAMSKDRESCVRRKLSATQAKLHQVETVWYAVIYLQRGIDTQRIQLFNLQNLKELRSSEEEEESQEDIATYESEIQECQAKIDEMMNEKREQERQLDELKTKMEACTLSLSTVESETELVTGKMEEMKLSEEKSRAQQTAEEASKVCERIETRRSRKSVESEISKLRRRIQQEEPHAAEKDGVAKNYLEKMELYEKTMATIRGHRAALKELQKGLMLRFKQYSALEDTITARACVYFKYFLQKRDYDGALRFNHDKGTLSMEVRMDCHSRRSQTTKNTKALSVGERSFTTVCFIMSLWEAIDSPFRCLDEFDVFMDMMNRRISMKLMVVCASEQRSKQFIFLTPQDMSQMGIEMGPHFKVLKLRPPERAQPTLD
ncbi:Structural maintenance of chromosomes protein 6 [Geodia barretti]|uniref:Structural maintenance of chromosomes protein 6 n=1 Tax=Geodia barretti TaxID=519541 RepID=A0AA35QZ26_GEOBA|nr:Structural maintenance of chromosomes protein 6 [Geodia barretti]